MGWISRMFRRSGTYSSEYDESDSDAAVTNCKHRLKNQMKIQLQKVETGSQVHSQLVPRQFSRKCHQLFLDQLDDIAKKVVASMLSRVAKHHGYQDAESGIFMVLSVLPWTREETIKILAELSSEPPFGYGAMMTNLFVNNWPSADLTHFFHVLLCLEGNCFEIHTAMGDYGGFPEAPRKFAVFPIDLLNQEERRILGL
jgi:hypothetical protein